MTARAALVALVVGTWGAGCGDDRVVEPCFGCADGDTAGAVPADPAQPSDTATAGPLDTADPGLTDTASATSPDTLGADTAAAPDADGLVDADPGEDTVASAACGPLPDLGGAPLAPAPGELYYAQLGLAGFALGEAAILVGPDGSVMVIDTGNDSHAGVVHDALAEVLAGLSAAGFPPRPADTIDHVVVTHLHADHVDGLDELLDAFDVRGRVVHRGFVDLAGADGAGVERACEALAARPGLELALCVSQVAAPCDPALRAGDHPAIACPGAPAGDALASPEGGLARLPLGEGAFVEVVAADAVIDGVRYGDAGEPWDGDADDAENARSVVAVVRHGAFALLLAGDLTGGGSDTPAVEGFYAPRLFGKAGLDARGVDVLHLNHHARATSSSAEWLDALLPPDGATRNALTGISLAHLGSPYAEVLARVFAGDRLAGGFVWVPLVTLGGATHEELVDAGGGEIRLRTFEGGRGYALQALDGDGVLFTRAFHAVRGCGAP